jgi:sec-independent protein translocase protein TatA
MFGLGQWEILIILVIVLVVFGAGKLPGVMSDLGKGVSEFKKSLKGDEPADEKTADKTDTPSKKKKV